MRKEQKRESLNDLWKVDTSPFHKKATIEEAFPQIESLTLEVEEVNGFDFKPTGKKRTYTKRDFPGEYLDCGNYQCHHGGIETGQLLRETVRNEQTEVTKSVHCHGMRTSPKGKVVKGICDRYFRLKLTIQYRLGV